MRVFLFVILILTFSQSGYAAITSYADFESGFGDWSASIREEGGIATLTRSTTHSRAGSYAARTFSDNGYRAEAEIWDKGYFAWYTEYWVGYSLYIKDSLPTSSWQGALITQHHATNPGWSWPCVAGPNGFSIRVVDGDLKFTGSTNASLVNVTPEHDGADWGEVPLYSTPAQVNKWYDIVMHFRYSPDSSGYWEIWVDGVKVVDYTGVTTYNKNRCGDQRGLYNWPKFGVYSGGGDGDVYVDEYRIGDSNSSYAEVSPAGGSPGTITCYKDVDGDDYSDGTSESVETCSANYFESGDLIATSGDCNDNNIAINPGATDSTCDGIDQDCSGSDNCPVGRFDWEFATYQVDESTGSVSLDIKRLDYTSGAASVDWGTAAITATTSNDYTGVDPTTVNFADGESSKTVSVTLTVDAVAEADETFRVYLKNPVSGTLDTEQDCPFTAPEQCDISIVTITETPGNITCYLDADGDLYSTGASEAVTSCSTNYYEASALTSTSGDCDDADATVNPGATEVCDDGKDNDCSGGDTACTSGVLFEDSFDSQADWQPSPGTNDESPSGATAACNEGDCSASVPAGWSYYRTTGLWWGPAYEETIRINSENYRGVAGKAYTQWNEANDGASGDGWGADGILSKYFPQDYSELYVQFWIKFKTGFQFRDGISDILKIARITHYDGSGSFYEFFSGGNQAPIYQLYAKDTSSYGWRHGHGFRCDPQSTEYYCPDGDDDDALFGGDFADVGNYGDGGWHRADLQVKMNTYAGNGSWNSDGSARFWHDGILKYEVTNKKWVVSGTDPNIGWNAVSIGGNAYNNYSDDSNHAEQWYAIDDVVVSTLPIPTDYTIGGGSPPASTSSATRGSGASLLNLGSGSSTLSW